LNQSRGLTPVIAKAAIPKQLYRSTTNERPRLTNNHTFRLKISYGAVRYPVKVLGLILYFQLSRKEHLLFVFGEELSQ
jgi:hypothetical protein